jgi:hypothetical protein
LIFIIQDTNRKTRVLKIFHFSCPLDKTQTTLAKVSLQQTPKELPITFDGSKYNTTAILVQNDVLFVQHKTLMTIYDLKDLKQLTCFPVLEVYNSKYLEYETGILSYFNEAELFIFDFRPHKDVKFTGLLFSENKNIEIALSKSTFPKLQGISFDFALQKNENTRILVGWKASDKDGGSLVTVDLRMKHMKDYLNKRDIQNWRVKDWIPRGSFGQVAGKEVGFLIIKMKRNGKGKYVFDNLTMGELGDYFPEYLLKVPEPETQPQTTIFTKLNEFMNYMFQ